MTQAAEGKRNFLEVPEVAALLHVPERTIRHWAATGKLPSYRMPGGRRRFRLKDVQKWLPDEVVS